jgi:protein phosphatase
MRASGKDHSEFSIEFAARSDVGRVRARNEDALHVEYQRGWAVLADGMGGYSGGDIAAQLGVDVVVRVLTRDLHDEMLGEQVQQVLTRAVEEANDQIWLAGLMNPAFLGMGSTLVVAVFLGDMVMSAHVGDSRLYRLGSTGLEQLTRDHSVVQEQVDEGLVSREQARHAPMRNMLTRGLGVMDVVVPEVGLHAAQDGDVFLLCSDGLTDMLEDDEIAQRLARGNSLDGIVDDLIDSANARGGRDNVSVIVARMRM